MVKTPIAHTGAMKYGKYVGGWDFNKLIHALQSFMNEFTLHFCNYVDETGVVTPLVASPAAINSSIMNERHGMYFTVL